MSTLRTQSDADIEPLVALTQRAWTDVEAAIDALLGSPLDRLATPSWAAHHEAVVRASCASADTTVVVAEDDDGDIAGFVAHTVHRPSDGMSAYGKGVVIGVDPRARNRGVGRALLDRCALAWRRCPAPRRTRRRVGYMLGGGLGWLTRRHGLAADRVLGFSWSLRTAGCVTPISRTASRRLRPAAGGRRNAAGFSGPCTRRRRTPPNRS